MGWGWEGFNFQNLPGQRVIQVFGKIRPDRDIYRYPVWNPLYTRFSKKYPVQTGFPPFHLQGWCWYWALSKTFRMTQVLVGIQSKTDFELVWGQDIYIPGNETGYKKGTRLDIFTSDEDEAGIGNKACSCFSSSQIVAAAIASTTVSWYRVEASTPD